MTIDDYIFHEDLETFHPVLSKENSLKLELEQVILSDSNKEKITDLATIGKELFASLETVRKYDIQKVSIENPFFPSVYSRVKNLENMFSNALIKVIYQLESQFTNTYTDLNSFAQREMWQEVSKRRQELDSYAELYSTLSEQVLSRPIFQDVDSSLLQNYLVSMHEREELLDSLNHVQDMYRNIEWNANSVGLLERIAGKKFLGLFRLRPPGGISLDEIKGEFQKLDFPEGVYETEQLRQEVLQTAQYLPKILEARPKIKEEINTALQDHKRVDSLLSKINGFYPSIDSSLLGELSDKYRDYSTVKLTEFENLEPLSQLVEEYRSLQKQIQEDIKTDIGELASKFANDFSKLDKIYSQGEISEPEQDSDFLENYENFILFAPNGIEVDPQDVVNLRDKVNHNKYDFSLRPIEDIAFYEPANYTDMESHISQIHSARAELEQLSDVPSSLRNKVNRLEGKLKDKISDYIKLDQEHQNIAQTTGNITTAYDRLKKSKYLSDKVNRLREAMQILRKDLSHPEEELLEDIVRERENSLQELKNLADKIYSSINEELQERWHESPANRPIVREMYDKLSDFFGVPELKEPEQYIPKHTQHRIIKLPSILSSGATEPSMRSDYFEISAYLNYIGINPNYLEVAETLSDSARTLEEKKAVLDSNFSTGKATTLQDYDYLLHVLYALGEDVTRGGIQADYSRSNSVRKNDFREGLSVLKKYISRSQDYLGLSPKEIEQRRAVHGSKNHYNAELCAAM